MSATDFLPRREADLRGWSCNFSEKINADPEAIGLTAAQAADYSAKHDAFITAYRLANEPCTRTRPSITAKNDALRAVRRAARQLAKIIHAARKATNAQKASLGLTVRRPGGRHAHLPRPRTAPHLLARSVTGRRVELRLRDPGEPTKRGRPSGVDRAVILMYIGDRPPADRSQWRWRGMTTRTRYAAMMPHDASPGTPVWFTARWENKRGEGGPLASPICAYAQHGLGAIGRADRRSAA